jgi:pimeloyl-ACP methyl ester carboxylesterase
VSAGLATLMVLLVAAALAIAFVWWPAEVRDVRSPYLMRVQSRYVDTPVARFHYTKTGVGSPVVLVPGGAQWIYSYRENVPALATQHTVYAVDLPGQGYTTLKQHGFGYDLDAMAGALGSFLDAVGLSRASIVGHSWGGGWSFAHPARVTTEVVDEDWAAVSRRENRRALWASQRNLDFSLTQRHMGSVRSPTLILWGDQDRWDKPWQANALASRIPGATAQILPGCGHNAHEDCPAQANPILAGFLTG